MNTPPPGCDGCPESQLRLFDGRCSVELKLKAVLAAIGILFQLQGQLQIAFLHWPEGSFQVCFCMEFECMGARMEGQVDVSQRNVRKGFRRRKVKQTGKLVDQFAERYTGFMCNFG